MIGWTLSGGMIRITSQSKNELKKFQSGKGVVKMTSQRKRGYGFYTVTPCFNW